jgi:WD40 repeat protein
LRGEPIRARPSSAWKQTIKWAKRRPAIAALTALVFVLTVAGFAAVTWQWQRAEHALERVRINLYLNHIREANAEWLAGNVARTEKLLDECPVDLHGWEWDYLKGLCHTELLSLRVPWTPNCVGFSPDGGHFMCVSSNRHKLGSSSNISVYDARTGEQTWQLSGDDYWFGSAAFSPNGRWLATVGLVSLNGTDIRPMIRGPRGVSLNLADAGAELAGRNFLPSGSFVSLWDATTGQEVYTVKIPLQRPIMIESGTGQAVQARMSGDAWFRSMAFSPDSRLLAMAGMELQIWEVQSRKMNHSFLLRNNGPRVACVAFSPDGKRLAACTGIRIRDEVLPLKVTIRDVATGQELSQFTGPADSSDSSSLALSRDGRQLALSSADGYVKLRDASTGREIPNAWHHRGGVTSMAYSPDGRYLATAGVDETARVWNTETGQEHLILRGHTDDIQAMAFSPDGRRLASASLDGTVRIWDAEASQEALTVRLDQEAVMMAFPNGHSLAVEGADHKLRMLDLTTGRQVSILDGNKPEVKSLASSPSGAYAANPETTSIRPDGKQIRVGTDGSLYDAASGQKFDLLERSYDFYEGPPFRYLFSPDGSRLVKSNERQVTVYDAMTGKKICMFSPAMRGSEVRREVWRVTPGVVLAAFSPDNRRLVTGGATGDIKLWDAQRGEEILTLRGHTGPVTGLVFSPDGRRLASASRDKTVKVWDSIRYRPESSGHR